MNVIPAVDVRGTKAVRLHRGRAGQETVYSDDPASVAERFAEEGAPWVHVVDLDAALGDGDNRELIGAICRNTQVPVQVGGGIRDLERIGEVIGLGAKRVILGTRAALEPEFVMRAVEEYAEKIVVAVDVRGGKVMVSGWTEEGPSLEDALQALDDAGTPRYLVTSIARDGTLEGPDLRLYQHVRKLTATPVIASGGVRTADDVWALRDLELEAVVTGKALYEKTLKISQVTRGQSS